MTLTANSTALVARPLFIALALMVGPAAAQTPDLPAPITFTVRTADGLDLPARVTLPSGTPKKVIVFINGSTPSDEAGFQAAQFAADGRPFRGRHDTYARFLTVMPARGYAVASMAKRSYVAPHRLPRPGLDDFARDVIALIDTLARRAVIRDERDLVIVGYSEGSLVAAKVLAMMRRPPAGGVLLGSATGAVDYARVSPAEWPWTGALRDRGWTEDRIRTEYERRKAYAEGLASIDEATFEQVWKKDDRRGIAPWESFAVARDTRVFDPVPALLSVKAPLLFCVGDHDSTMPVALARGVFDRLRAAGRNDVSFKVIENDVHQLQRYDVYLVLDAWIGSAGRNVDFVPSPADRAAMERAASVASLLQAISALPFAGEPDKAAAAYTQAGTLHLEDSRAWFKLGMLLVDGRRLDEALAAFQAALAHDHDAPHAVMTWAGHVCDLKGNRPVALEWYRKALAADNGMPMRHDHLGITIDRAWIERRLGEPYAGPPAARVPGR